MDASRKDDIISNIEFAMDSNRELSTLISNAQRDDEAVKHISQKSATILASIRECFDYCISDIKDDYLPNEKRRVYYPFNQDSFKEGMPLKQLENTNQPLYQKLQGIATLIQSKQGIPGTMCNYGDVKAINDLVNLKKHNKILVVCELGRSKARIDFLNGSSSTVSPIFPVGEDGLPDFRNPGKVAPEDWISSPGVKVTAVKEFFFDNTSIDMSRADIHGFCMTSITIARFVLGEIYHVAYGMSLDTFHDKN